MEIPTPHIISQQAEALGLILEPHVNLCLWQRQALNDVSAEVANLNADDLPDIRCKTRRQTFASDLAGLLEKRDQDPALFKTWLADIEQLAEHFFALSNGNAVTARLETTDQDACRRFHVDRTQLRLLCTYKGPATQWLANDQVDRMAQIAGAPNEAIIRFGEPAEFRPFWVGIMKGETFPNNSGAGLVHRSPPISGSGQTRVLFCMDC